MILRLYACRTEERALSRKEILESVKESLSNLDLEYIDLVIIHKSDPHCPVEGNLIYAVYLRIKFILSDIGTFQVQVLNCKLNVHIYCFLKPEFLSKHECIVKGV